jgi:hypothetical protein
MFPLLKLVRCACCLQLALQGNPAGGAGRYPQ